MCPLSNASFVQAICNSSTSGPGNDTYNLEISYDGMSSLATVSNLSGSGVVTYGGVAGELDGSNITIENISENDDWAIRIFNDGCLIILKGKAPTCDPPPNLIINESDADTPGTDNEEFIELKGMPGQSLDDIILALYDGSDNEVYNAYDLSQETIPPDSFFVVCFGNNTNAYCDLTVTGSMQNGADGIGLFYSSDISDFPNGAPLTSENLVDGLVYDTDDADDPELLSVLNPNNTGQINEDDNNNKDLESIQWNGNNWFVAIATPGASNDIALPITFLSFDVEKFSKGHRLNWEYTDVFYLDYFLVQNSRNGLHWKNLQKIAFTEDLRLDKFEHSYISKAEQHRDNNYRIKAVDFDGSQVYSPIKFISLSEAKEKYKIFPSLVENAIHISIPVSDIGAAKKILILDASGHVVHEAVLGPEHFSPLIQVSHLLSGIYFVLVNDSSKQFIGQFYKQ